MGNQKKVSREKEYLCYQVYLFPGEISQVLKLVKKIFWKNVCHHPSDVKFLKTSLRRTRRARTSRGLPFNLHQNKNSLFFTRVFNLLFWKGNQLVTQTLKVVLEIWTLTSVFGFCESVTSAVCYYIAGMYMLSA